MNVFKIQKTRAINNLILILSWGILSILSVGKATAQTNKPDTSQQRIFEPEVKMQKEDYTKIRRNFRTNIIRKGPAPQEWIPYKVPTDVTQVEFTSDNLRLKAWMNKPEDLTTKKATVLFLHGGFSFGEADWDMTKPYRDSGFIVLIPILRGENGQPGYFSMFYDEVDDVIAAAKFLREQPFVDKSHLYLAGHSAGGTITLLTVEASKFFRAAASFDGSPDQQLLFGVTGSARRSWIPKEVVFDHSNLEELQVRSPLAFAKSFKCPVRLYYSTEAAFLYSRASIRSAEIAKSQNKDVAAIQVEGSHLSHVEPAIRQSIVFFHDLETKK